MVSRRCAIHERPLRWDESYVDSRPDGIGPLGTEVTFTVVRWACPLADCGYAIEEITDRD